MNERQDRVLVLLLGKEFHLVHFVLKEQKGKTDFHLVRFVLNEQKGKTLQHHLRKLTSASFF